MPGTSGCETPCAKRPLIKNWDKPKTIPVITPSKYQTADPEVKKYWKNVIKELDQTYTDEKFWDTQGPAVRQLVGPVVYERLANIFNLPPGRERYEPASEKSSLTASETFYTDRLYAKIMSTMKVPSNYQIDNIESMGEGIEEEEIPSQPSEWTIKSEPELSDIRIEKKKSIMKKPVMQRTTIAAGRTKPVPQFAFSKSRLKSRMFNRSAQKVSSRRSFTMYSEEPDDAFTEDDIVVHPSEKGEDLRRGIRLGAKPTRNPHFELLYCCESETDMIKWNSKYKKKAVVVSSSDEHNKKAELLTKKICDNFYEWWINCGSKDYKSDIKAPEDIESLFQLWFDEHASRGLKLDPFYLPCVLECIAEFVGVPDAACPKALWRQIKSDVKAETTPTHCRAFNTSLPKHMRHYPPRNHTDKIWADVKVPQDLKDMTTVWGEISHLTSTKSFTKWLFQHPSTPIPPCLENLDDPESKKQMPFAVPSDFVFRKLGDTSASQMELTIPTAKLDVELSQMISSLMKDV